ncbi:MAG: hypothetical protein NZ480_04935 [Bdellovibrionaceae bacterium]|nr:hypothetical protein [Pseudobdellovibrionaceae bacterium]MDW8191011.1 biotin/lipoyl-containing protein [Pseudobdellovibrionaceae bacterium]
MNQISKKKQPRVFAIRVGERIWGYINGKIKVWEIGQSKKRHRSHSGSGTSLSNPECIVAPMPGRITKIFAQVGKPCIKGEVLVIMEAMKMEYSLKAEINGIVQRVRVAEGQQVALGEVLVDLVVQSVT